LSDLNCFIWVFPIGRAIRYIFFTFPLRYNIKKDAAAIPNTMQSKK